MSEPIISKEMMEAMAQVYWSHHPDGSWEDFDKRLDWVYEMTERSIQKVSQPSPLLAWLRSKGGLDDLRKPEEPKCTS